MDKCVRVRIGVVLVKDDKILLIKQRKYNKEYWLVPGGGVNFGESVKESAKREMKEEINLDIDLESFLFLWESINPDGSKHVLNMYFLGRILGGELKLGDESNLIDLQWFEFERLNNLLMYPPITDQLIELKNNNFKCLAKIPDAQWKE